MSVRARPWHRHGLCFGETVAFFKDIGKAFILLLQMMVQPTSLCH